MLRQSTHVEPMHRLLLSDVFFCNFNIGFDSRIDIIFKSLKFVIIQWPR